MNVNADFLSKWFTGKALLNAQAALDILNRSLAVGYWVERGSQKVPAAMGKSNVAAKLCPKVGWNHPLSDISSLTRYGQFTRAQEFDFNAAMAGMESEENKAVVAKTMEWAADFKPVVDAIAYLNEESENNKALANPFDVKNPIGQCACCFRVQKVKPDGTMFKHGFKRPGDGNIYGECDGSQFPPYRLPKGALK